MIKPLCRHGFSLVIVLLSLTATTAADSLSSRYYEDAITRFAQGDNAGALIQLKNALQNDPSQLPARVLIARVYMSLGNFASAEKELLMSRRMGADLSEIAVPLAKARNELKKFQINIEELHPDEFPVPIRADLWSHLGLARIHTDDLDGAEIAFRNALALNPDHSDANLGLARIPLQTGDYKRALDQVDAVLLGKPDDPNGWYLRGAILHAQGRYRDAIDSYQRTLVLSPAHLQAALGEAASTLDMGNAQRAVRLFDAFGKAHPFHPEAPYLLAQAYAQLGQLAEAKSALQQASSILGSVAPEDLHNNPPYLMLGALIAFENDQPEAAYKYLSLYLQKQPNDVKAQKLQAATLIELKKPLHATRILLSLVTSAKADAHVYVMLGDANIQLKDYVSAERHYAQALKRAGRISALGNKIGFAQFGQGRFDDAIATFKGQHDSGGKFNHRASVFLGILYFSQGRLEDAILVVNRVLHQQPDNLIALNLKGAVVLAQGDRAQARTLFASVIERQPNFRPARFNMAKLEAAEGRSSVALKILERFLTANPNDIRALHESARIHLQLGELRKAMQYLERVRNVNAKALSPIMQLVDVYIQAGRVADAVSTAQTLYAKLPKNVLVLHSLAKAQIAANQIDAARNTLKRAVSSAGYDVELLIRTGQLQIAAGALDDAYWSLSSAVKERPDSVAARNALAGLHFRRGELEAAETQLSVVKEVAPDNLFRLVLSGDIAFARKNYDQAIETYRKGLKVAKRDSLSASFYRALMGAGRSREALQHIRNWTETYPASVQSLRLLAERYHHDGEFDKAWSAYERLTKLTPEDGLVFNNFAVMLADLDNERALEMARRAHRLAPDHPAVLDTLGWALIQLGELEEGLSHLRDAVARNADSPTLRYHLGVGLQEYGKEVEARIELERALAMGKDFDDAKAARQRLESLDLNR